MMKVVQHCEPSVQRLSTLGAQIQNLGFLVKIPVCCQHPVSGDAKMSTMPDKVPRNPMYFDGKGWSPLQMKRFLEHGRDWKPVIRFYERLVNGQASLGDLGLVSGEECLLGSNWGQKMQDFSEIQKAGCTVDGQQGDKNQRITYKVALSYNGVAFEGWSKQTGLYTLEGVLQEAMSKRFPESKITVSTAGRTDKGVHACAQVISFYAWCSLAPHHIVNAVNCIRPGEMRAWWAGQVPRSFHATYSAEFRRYVYLFPLRDGDQVCTVVTPDSAQSTHQDRDLSTAGEREWNADFDPAPVDSIDVNVELVDQLLQHMEGKTLDFHSFARDTPKGKECSCSVYYARAKQVHIPKSGEGVGDAPVLCIELVCNRFLRRMVRVLVSTAIREATVVGGKCGGDVDALVQLCGCKNRLATALTAPGHGLCFAGAGFGGAFRVDGLQVFPPEC